MSARYIVFCSSYLSDVSVLSKVLVVLFYS
jgi:hypothetical protein